MHATEAISEVNRLSQKTNDALVASLLRLKDNNCHLVEAERVLKKASKFTELVRRTSVTLSLHSWFKTLLLR